MINLEMLPLSFSAGIATFFSPCFGAMLPAYISTYLGRKDRTHSSMWRRGIDGVTLGSVVSLGFVTSFALLGIAISFIGSFIARYLRWVAITVATFILIMGIIFVVRPAFSFSLGHIAGRWFFPSANSSFVSFYNYGILYSICAAACSFPIFLAVMAQSLSHGGVVNGVLHFLAYAAGMGTMMIIFSLGLAISKGTVIRFFPRIIGIFQRFSGLFLILAGGYVLYYLLIYGRYWQAIFPLSS